MKLTAKEVRRIAALARLQLTDQEVESYRHQLSTVLDYVAQLEQVATESVAPTAQVTGLTTVLADDAVAERHLTTDQLLANAPQRVEDAIKVAAVFGGDR